HFRIFSFFFFQAEDGIRDFHVTGVQTCALPIYFSPASRVAPVRERRRADGGNGRKAGGQRAAGDRPPRAAVVPRRLRPRAPRGRSEERRVGKECRPGWSA